MQIHRVFGRAKNGYGNSARFKCPLAKTHMAASRDEKIATPERSIYNIRSASGRFCKVGKIENKQETTRKLHEGFQKWNVKRKLEYENASRENEPPTKRGKRSTKVSKVFLP